MAGERAAEKEVFRRSTMNRVASADELDHYIKVTNPKAWAVVLAAFLLVSGVVIWAVLAVVPVTVETTGFTAKSASADKPLVYCWVNAQTAKRIGNAGLKASVDGVEAKSATMSSTPMSASEVVKLLGNDFYADSIELDQWNYLVTIEPGDAPNHTDFSIETTLGDVHLVPVSIIVYETHPITIVLGKQ